MANEKNVKLNFTAPTIMVDGNGTGVNPDNSINLVFFQIQGEMDNEVVGNVVSSLRMNATQAEQLRDSLGEVLKQLPKEETKEA